MKKMVFVLTLAAFALSGSAFAQDPNYFNNIGTYLTPEGWMDPAAEDGTGSCGYFGEFEAFHVYVVLSKLTNNQVAGWEAKIIPDNMTLLNITFTGDVINAGTRDHEYVMGLGSPLFTSNDALVLADMELGIFPTQGDDVSMPSYLWIEGVYFSAINPIQGPPAYVVDPGGSEFVELHNAIGDPHNGDLPQLVINGDCEPVAVEESTWGNVKSLYR